MALYAYVGSRTTRERNARGEGISVFRVEDQTGQMDLVQVVRDLINPSFLTLNAKGDVLYTVHGDRHEVSAFRVSAVDGFLSFLNQRSCGGQNPVHLALDPSGRFLVVSNHLSGTLAVMPIDEEGKLGEVSQLVALEGQPGPHKVEQPFSKPHFNPFDASGRFVVVPDKGLDRVFCFRFESGRLSAAAMPWFNSREGAGPRHLAFHPNAPWAYVVNELDSTVTTCRFSTETGALEPVQTVPTLPDTFTGNSRASEIAIDRAGRTLYASNRGWDSIAMFRIEPATGRLAFLGTEPAQGRTPRFFGIHPNGHWLYALNEESDSIVLFDVDVNTGKLSSSGLSTPCASPVCMVFSPR
jgi:6-phosphogluconolactonase